MSRCAGARAGRRGAAGAFGAAGGAGCPARRAGGAGRGARAAAEARLAQFVAAAEPRPAVAWEAGPLARDGAQGGRPAWSSWSRAIVVSDRASDGRRRPLAGALQLWSRLRRGGARAGWRARSPSGRRAAAAGGRDQRAPAAAAPLSLLRSHGAGGAADGVSRGCFGPTLEAAIAALTVRNRLGSGTCARSRRTCSNSGRRSGRSPRCPT
jgi:hypothetical protein